MSARRSRQDEVQFTITYDGPDVEAGRMDAQVLGSAMLSMSQLIESSAALTFGSSTRVDVEVAADFKRGSFSFGVVTSANLDIGRQILQSINMGHLLAILGITGGGGLIALIKWLKGRQPRSVEPAPDGTNVRVTTADGDSTVVNGQTIVLANNSTVRVHLDGVVTPLKRDGITEFRSGRGTNAETVIHEDEVELFEPPPIKGEKLQDKVSPEIVQIESISFLPDRKWRFRLADGTGFYSTLDDDFAKRVLHHSVLFGAGDALEVDLRTIVVRDETGNLRAEREIVRVLRHLPAPKQLSLGPGGAPANEE